MDTVIPSKNVKIVFSEKIKKILKNKLLSGAIIFALLIILFFIFKSFGSGTSKISYATAKAEKGTLIVTTSGTGQVDTSKQTDIKTKASGNVAYLSIAKGDIVSAGTVIAQIDTTDAQKTIRDASLNLENAQIALEKLKQPSDEYSIAQAELNLEQAKSDLEDLKNPSDSTALVSAQNAVLQAQRDVQQAKDNLEKLTLDTNQTLAKAYEDGFSAVSNAYLDIPQLVEDAYRVEYDKDATNGSDNIGSYKLILSDRSVFISNFLSNYESAKELFDASFLYFKLNQRSEDTNVAYKLIDNTYSTAKAVSAALESARNIIDAIENTDNYEDYYIADEVELLKPIIMNDLPVINKHISALKTAKDTIDTTNQNSPINLKNAQDAIDSAEEKLKEKQLALNDIKSPTTDEIKTAEIKVKQMQIALDDILAGSDPLDIKSQELNVQQKLNALNDAKIALADYAVSAPYDATIADINISEDDDVSSGTVVATAITNKMIAAISLNEVDVAKIKTGQKVTLSFDAIEDLTITGEVVEIDTLGTVSQGVVTYGVKIAFDTQDARIKPGMSVSAEIITDSAVDVIMVPNSAVKTQGDINYVEVAQSASGDAMANILQEQIKQVQVETGLSNDTYTEIKSGINEGDVVITRTITSGKTSSSTSSSSSRSSPGGFAMFGR